MHELAITESIVDICRNNSGGRRVTSVTVVIGQLSCVTSDAVEFCFEACIRDTPLQGARLVIERPPGRGRCNECGQEFALQTIYAACPACGGFRISICSGEELRVKELEVE